MANEIITTIFETNLTDVFACVSKDDSATLKVHKGNNTWEIFSLANLDTYDVLLSEIGNSGSYAGDFPTEIVTAGRYRIDIFRGTPATPEITHRLGSGELIWNGSSEVPDVDPAKLGMAIKILKNKTVQNKLTGQMTVYDDDGQTAALYLTPDDDGENITLTPSEPS